MGRERRHETDAARAKAYRERKKAQRLAERDAERPEQVAAVALLTEALESAAAGGFTPAMALLTAHHGANPAEIVNALAEWLRLHAARQEKQQRWEDRAAGWNMAMEWVGFTNPGASREDIQRVRARVSAFWDEQRRDLGLPDNWFDRPREPSPLEREALRELAEHRQKEAAKS